MNTRSRSFIDVNTKIRGPYHSWLLPRYLGVRKAKYRSAACACLALVPLAGVAGWESLEKVVTPGGWDFEHGRVPAQSGAAEALAVAFENLACRQNTACAGGEVKMLTLKGMKTGLFASMFQATARRFSCSLHATPPCGL